MTPLPGPLVGARPGAINHLESTIEHNKDARPTLAEQEPVSQNEA